MSCFERAGEKPTRWLRKWKPLIVLGSEPTKVFVKTAKL